jgi:hypothetical protein
VGMQHNMSNLKIHAGGDLEQLYKKKSKLG